MKLYKSLIVLALLCMPFLLTDCKKSDGTTQTPQDAQLIKLSKTWKVTGASDVTKDGVVQTGYTGFTLTVQGNPGQTTFGYSTSGRPALSPWPSSGNFTFGTDFATQLTRDDTPPLPVTYSVTDTQLQLTFNYTGTGFTGRTGNVTGNWVFTLKP